MTEKLKHCPCCGAEAYLAEVDDGFRVYCLCGFRTDVFKTRGRATAVWNARPLEELTEKIGKLEAENTRLREALEFYAELDGNGIQLYGDMDSKDLEFVDGDSRPFGKIARDALKWGGK